MAAPDRTVVYMDAHSSLQRMIDGASHEPVRLNAALGCCRSVVECEMRRVPGEVDCDSALHRFYGQMAYHLGCVDEQLQPASLPGGKLLRPAKP